MTDECAPNLNKEILNFFSRHLLAIAVTVVEIDSDGKPCANEQFGVYSGFLMEIGNKLLFVTAGHVVNELEDIEKNKNMKLTCQRLVDFLATDSKHDMAIPIDLSIIPNFKLEDFEKGYDIGLYELEGLFKENVEANNTVPVTPQHISTEAEQFESTHFLAGFPKEYVKEHKYSTSSTIMGLSFMPSLVPVKKLQDEDNGFAGEIIDMGNQSSIVGMSGGMIIGYQIGSGSQPNAYKIVAIQSRWDESRKVIKGSYLHCIPDAIDEHFRNSGSK